jgi:hypothetical protein
MAGRLMRNPGNAMAKRIMREMPLPTAMLILSIQSGGEMVRTCPPKFRKNNSFY